MPATQGYGTDISLPAGADLSAKQFFFVKVNSSGQVVLTGAGETAIGILQNNPASGLMATVRILGKSLAKSGGSITAGNLVTSNASGKAAAATLAKVNTSNTGAAADPVI